jgi:hypothetical protein
VDKEFGAWVTPSVEEISGRTKCYDCPVFNFGKPKTAGQWMAHVVLGIVALFLVWWMLRLYVL